LGRSIRTSSFDLSAVIETIRARLPGTALSIAAWVSASAGSNQTSPLLLPL
jgi:hypothetical protein